MWIQRFVDNSWLSCHKYAQRSSQACDQDLPFRERLGLLVHHYLCPGCRKFTANIRKLQQLVRMLSGKIESGEVIPGKKLSPERKQTILSVLEAQ